MYGSESGWSLQWANWQKYVNAKDRVLCEPRLYQQRCFVNNIYITLSGTDEERYKGARMREFCNNRNGVRFLDICKEDNNNINAIVYIMYWEGV